MGRKVLASKAGTILSVKGRDRTVSVFANMVKSTKNTNSPKNTFEKFIQLL
jgi:hypothetical protein